MELLKKDPFAIKVIREKPSFFGKFTCLIDLSWLPPNEGSNALIRKLNKNIKTLLFEFE
jgi:hypothetical protein